MTQESREIIDSFNRCIDRLQDEIRELKREAYNQHTAQIICFMSMGFTVGVFILALKILSLVK